MSKTINAGRVTFVPKDNFSNNISYKKFDIVTYNGSSYFAKKDTIGHTPTEEEFWQLVAEKGQNGAPGAVKMQVVDTLPETGQTDTIYLVKKDNPGEQNLYDEYVYTETGWEHIGDTSVDLSDYYTKEESDKKLLTKQDKLVAGENITISEDNVISAKGGELIYEIDLNDSDLTNINRLDKTMISNIITSMYNDANHIGRLRIKLKSSNENIADVSFVDFFPCDKSVPFTQLRQYKFLSDVFYQVAGSPINQNNINLSFGYIIINGSWTEDVFTCTSINYLESFRKQMSKFALTDNVLTKTNTTSYTPTNDYNPSTKKYVDDAVANINIHMYTITTTKSFMDNYINFETDVINKMTEIVNKNLDTGFELYIVDTSGMTFRFDICMRTPSDTSNSSTSVIGYGLGRQFYNIVRRFIVQYSAKDGLYTFSQFISDGTQIVTFNNEVLTRDNTGVYTPTGNYNPATKKYVDDQVGNINTILATLTTVSEVSK